MRGGAQRRTRARVTDQIRATLIDHVINHGLSYREAGERVQPNLSWDTVASIVSNFRETKRIQCLPPSECGQMQKTGQIRRLLFFFFFYSIIPVLFLFVYLAVMSFCK